MTPHELKSLIRECPAHNRCDLTHLFANAQGFSSLVAKMAAPFRDQRIDAIAALDASGFALGGAVAQSLGTGLILLRKPGKAAWPTLAQEFADYTCKLSAFHLVTDAISPGQRVLLVHDWSETGAQAYAAIQLLERAGAVVVGASLIHIEHRVRDDPRFRSYQLHGIMEDESSS